MKCEKCGRELKDPDSISLGYGPVCARRLGMIGITKMPSKRKGVARKNHSDLEESKIPGQMSILDLD